MNFVPFACCEGLSLAELSPVGLSEDAANSSPKEAVQPLEHYELVIDKDGQPIELGRGAMGVTYKAFDVDLRCPVTLKVISEKYLGDEAARIFAGSACRGERDHPEWSLWRGKLSTTSSSAQGHLK